MAAPALRIPVELDTEALKRQMEKGAAHVNEGVKAMRLGFEQLNKAVIGAAGGAIASQLLRTATVVGGIVVAFKLLEGAIAGTREQLKEMVDIFDRARSAGVSSEFFQSFIAGAKGAKDMIEVLQGALESARRASTARLDTRGSILDAETLKTQWSDLEQSIQRAVVLLQGASLGPQQFLTATNQDEKTRAVLQTMNDLLKAGQKLEAMDLGEKMFGTKFVDNVRNGKLSVEELIATIDRLLVGKGSGELFGEKIISNETVARAKELDERLTEAWRITEQNLKPAWGVLGNIALDIKNAWATIVELMAKATGLLPQIASAMRNMDVARLTEQRGGIIEQINSGALSQPRLRQLQNQLKSIDETLSALAPPTAAVTVRPALAPLTTDAIRRALGGATPREVPAAAAEETRTRTEAAIDGLKRRTAGIEQETAAIDKGTAAREEARVKAELLEVANTKGSGATEENRKQIELLAAAYGRAAEAMEQARSPLATFARQSADISKQLNQFGAQALDKFTDSLANVITGTQKLSEAFHQMAISILNDLAKIIIRQQITGPLASGLQGLFTPGAGAPLIFAPGMMAGGSVSAGQPYVVGERGPELMVPGASGMVVPNGSWGRGGGTVVNIANYTNEPVQRTERSDNNLDIIDIVVGRVGSAIGEGRYDAPMRRYGASPMGVRR